MIYSHTKKRSYILLIKRKPKRKKRSKNRKRKPFLASKLANYSVPLIGKAIRKGTVSFYLNTVMFYTHKSV